MTYLLFFLGFILLIKGADVLIDGASAFAKRFKITNIVIGLTIVAFGTSMPEFFINLVSNLRGSSDLAAGNIIGACIANIFLISGLAALIHPVKINGHKIWKELLLGLAAIIALFILLNDFWLNNPSFLGRMDGIILVIFFFGFLYYVIGVRKAKKENHGQAPDFHPLISIIYIIVGVLGLGIGGHLVVANAVKIAREFGLSQTLIALTVISLGTTLPELVTALIATIKKKAGLAIGNIIGSIIFNVAFILGLNAIIKPIPFNPDFNSDLLVAVVGIIILIFFVVNGRKPKTISRFEGALLFLGYLGYLIFVFFRG
ncbi:MAG: calcium/sodium antiporter [Patescibacteria group bacterium]